MRSAQILQTTQTDQAFLARIAADADREAAAILPLLLASRQESSARAGMPHRTAMSHLLGLVTVFTSPESGLHGSRQLVDPMIGCLERLEQLQGPDGLFGGDNLSSPPDSAFTINDACLAVQLLRAQGGESGIRTGAGSRGAGSEGAGSEGAGSKSAAVLQEIEARLWQIIAKITPALVEGGVHTPNHRWELCAALAQIHSLDPRPEIDRRIDEWLAEGIDQLPDGMYSERSPLYASAVTNPSLLIIADSSGRPELLDHVRKNLEAFLPWFNPDGTVESVFSRRQDQWLDFGGAGFLLPYRRLAIQDGRSDFAAAAGWLAGFPLLEPAKLLAQTKVQPGLAGVLTQGQEPVPQEQNEQVQQGQKQRGQVQMPSVLQPARAALGSCATYRFRQGETAVTVFGGGDHSASGVASGLSNNPTFLRFRHGNSVLSDVRLTRNFFNLGPFRSMGTVAEGEDVRLHERVEASFYLPLPAERRREDGIYEQSHEGRFSAAMDFAGRPAVQHWLRTEVTVAVNGHQADVDITFDGAHTSFALELTFRSGGVLEGVEEVSEGVYQLVASMGRYSVGGDVIEFGPGSAADPDTPPVYNAGENYTYLRGTNASEGTKVYITGRTSGTRRLTLRGTGATAGAAAVGP
ncbi:hypothetical protein [Arthrobacter sp.]|uniref:hypothetical protein n=1 Tax=Arthrobacter sp. TaxID=1667 RepID=UPI0028123F32|nr:hypothetical protein [Arthrobacter sp.]